MSSREFKDTIYQASLKLSKDEAHDLAYLNDLPYKFRECDRPMDVLIQLEVMQIITESNPETLAKVFERIKRKDLAKLVRQKNTDKKSAEKKKPAEDNNLLNIDKMLLIELATIQMQMEHAIRRIKKFKISMQTRNGQLTDCDDQEFRKTLECCSIAKQNLTNVQQRNFNREELSSDEDITPPSTIKRPAGAVPVLPDLTGSLLRSRQQQEEEEESEYENQTGSGDSGFVNAQQYLKVPLQATLSDNHDEEENTYELVSNASLYMRLKPNEVIKNEYHKPTPQKNKVKDQPHIDTPEDDAYSDILY